MFKPTDPWFVTVEHGGRTVGAAMHTRPSVWVGPISDGVTADGVTADGVVAALVGAVLVSGRLVSGVSGPLDTASAFARDWSARTGAAVDVAVAEGVHLLGTLRAPVGVPGRARPATLDDLTLCAAWWEAFQAEALPHQPNTPGAAADFLPGPIRAGRLLLWEVDGTPVSLAGRQGPVHGTGRIGPVWTPPEHRRHGYAAAVTAAASQAVLDAGALRCILFTDLANPTSNGVYARLGYERVGEAADYTFRSP